MTDSRGEYAAGAFYLLKLCKSRSIWQGNGGRFLESPHLYKINNTYYKILAGGIVGGYHIKTTVIMTDSRGEYAAGAYIILWRPKAVRNTDT